MYSLYLGSILFSEDFSNSPVIGLNFELIVLLLKLLGFRKAISFSKWFKFFKRLAAGKLAKWFIKCNSFSSVSWLALWKVSKGMRDLRQFLEYSWGMFGIWLSSRKLMFNYGEIVNRIVPVSRSNIFSVLS